MIVLGILLIMVLNIVSGTNLVDINPLLAVFNFVVAGVLAALIMYKYLNDGWE